MIVIFAKLNTNEKVAVECASINDKVDVQKKLHIKDGGNWVAVEEVKFGTILKFTDDKIYKGYSPKIKKYTNTEKLY